MAELGSILLRRGTTAERLEFVPLIGEIIYDTELKQVFVGDAETYGGRTVFDNTIVVDSTGTLNVGDNVAVIVGDDGLARSLRLPGGTDKDRPLPTQGALRFNTTDKTLEFSDGDEWYYLDKNVISGNVIELHVSLDGTDTRRYGAQRGRSWGTAFKTLNVAMREAEDIVNANPETEPFVNEEQPYRKIQVLVKVASGIYEEHLPIRVPANTSIFGSGQRRTTIRPKAGIVSQSPWTKVRFWRETTAFPNGYFGFHYLTDPRDEFSTPKDNTDIDIFLCNDTNWFHDFGTDLHNSFGFVLDPEGQILTKSPYPHTGVCFPKSSFATSPYEVGFHGGMFADGFTGNQDFNIDAVESGGAMVASGFWRKPAMPTAFYIGGTRYQADSAEADGTGEEDGAELLRLNRAFIQEETIQYVNDTYLFKYNESKCRRDLNIILRNVGYDNVLGTNFLTYFTSNAYLRPNSAYVLSDQNEQTRGGINSAKGLANTSLAGHTPTQEKNVELFNNILTTISDRTLPTLYWPTTVYDDEKDAAKAILLANINFIKQELIAWINYQVVNNVAPFGLNYVYDQEKCNRDTELLINGLIFDLLYNGNYATIEIARSYWLGTVSQIPTQQTQHAAAYTFLSSIVTKILTNDNNISWLDKFQLNEPQVLVEVITPPNAALIQKASSLITTITEIVENGTNYSPIVEYPDLTTLYNNRPPLYKEELQNVIDARTQLVTDTTSIINDSIAYINTTYASFKYDEATCRRDVGLIIDAMRHDLIYSGEVETVKAAKTYFETGSTVIADQEAETVDAINYARDLAISVVENSNPVKVYQNTITQVQDSSYQSGLTIDTKVTDLFAIITNCISNFTSIKAAHDLLESNKAWIQDEVIAFIATTYPSLTYQTAICKRDAGYIISAISNDLFGGYVRTEEAGRAYYRGLSAVGNTEVVQNEQRTETLAANEYARSLVAQVLLNSESNTGYPSSPYQAVTSQTTNSIVVSSTIKEKADASYNIIIDMIGDGGESAGPGALPKYKININDSTPLPYEVADKNATMITAGNKSFVATDWTMFGNLGYGVLARNNARCELVSIFTYYCGYTYKAESGSEIRSLNGSSSNGIYGLGAEGRNPYEVPVTATTVSETAFVAKADSAIVGDNVLGDLQIVIKDAVDITGSTPQLFNVMVAEVDHGGATGVVRYEIGNFQNNALNIRGSAQGLLANIPNDANINIRLLQEYEVDTDQDISQLLLGAALIYDNDSETGYRIIDISPNEGFDNRFKIRTIPTLNHISIVISGSVSLGVNQFVINSINYTEADILNRRIAYDGTVYKVTAYNSSTRTITLDKVLTSNLTDLQSIRLSPAPGETGKIFTDFSVVKAGNHDMLDVGTGAYEDSNYPRELYGPPTRDKVQNQEVVEGPPGRVFFTTNDQDGNFRVGDYFRVNQGDGSISFNAAIALSNLDGLGFSRGVTINEFSADSDMTGISDEAVPTEQSVVNYINKRLGQDTAGITVGATRLGVGTLMLDGSQAMEGDLDLNSNDILSAGVVNTTNVISTNVTASTLDVNTSATIATLQVEDLTNNRIVVSGAGGELLDYAELTFDGNTLTIVSSDSTTALNVTGTANFTGELNLDGDLYTSGNIIPTIADTWSLGSETHPWADLYLGPGSLYINNKKVISDEDDGITISTSAPDQNINLAADGTGSINFTSTANAQTLTATDITVDNVVIDSNTVTINGNIIRGTGTAASGVITLQPGLTGAALGDVTVIGNLNITGSLSTTESELTNQLISGNLTVETNTTLGTNAEDTLTIVASLNSNIVPLTNNAHNIGSSTLRISSVFANALDSNSLTINAAGDLTMKNVANAAVFSIDGATGNTIQEGNLRLNNASNINIYDNSSPSPISVFTVNGESGTTLIRKGGILRIYNNDASPDVMFEASGATGNLFVHNDVDVNGNMDIAGNLTIGGDLISDLSIEDNTIVLNTGFAGDPAVTVLDAGVEVERGTGTNVKLLWNETSDTWTFTNDGTTYFDIASTSSVATVASNLSTVTTNLATVAALDPTLTLSGDVSGTATFTNLGDATLSVTIPDVYTEKNNFNWRGTGALTSTTTAALKTELLTRDVFDSNVSAFKTSWSYAGNANLTDAGRFTEMAGTSWLTWTDNATDNTQGNFTALAIAPNTGGSAGKMFVYNDQGSTYAPGWREIWTSTSDGTGSGLDADLLDGQEGTYYATAASVTAIAALDPTLTLAGDATGTATFTNLGDATLTVAIANDSHNHSSSSGDFQVGGDLYAVGGQVHVNSGNNRTKYSMWGNNDTTYGIGMGNAYTFGGIGNEYVMSFQMNNTSTRGFWWGDNGHTNAQGAMALTTNGKLTVAHSVRIGYGESDTTTPGATYELDVSGDARVTGALAMTGTSTLTTRAISTGAGTTTGTITGRWSLGASSRFEATYADLAEIYVTDQDYEVGTIVMFGGDKELTISNEYATTQVAGVISTDPAFIMNNETEGQPVALKGRVPVKVEGIVRKGNFIVASNTPGVGVAVDNYIGGAIIGKAIEDKNTIEIDLIEVKI